MLQHHKLLPICYYITIEHLVEAKEYVNSYLEQHNIGQQSKTQHNVLKMECELSADGVQYYLHINRNLLSMDDEKAMLNYFDHVFKINEDLIRPRFNSLEEIYEAMDNAMQPRHKNY